MAVVKQVRGWVGVATAIAIVLIVARFGPVKSHLLSTLSWTQQQGAIGWLVFCLLYIASSSALLPGSILTLGAGLAFGVALGTALVVPASMTSAFLAFVIARYFARSGFVQRVVEQRRIGAIGDVVASDALAKSGFKLVLLLRLSPVVPFSLLNYALGLTKVSLGDYLRASFWGMLPGTILYVYLGSLFTHVADLGRGTKVLGSVGQAAYWVGLGVTLVTSVALTRLAKQTLRDMTNSSAQPEAT